MKKLLALLLAFALLVPAAPARANEPLPLLLGSTQPTSAELTDAVRAYVETSPPVPGNYVITYTQAHSAGRFYVSMAATGVTEYAEFSLVSEQTRWMGTIIIDITTGAGELYTAQLRNAKVASLPFAGGGPNIAFPFASGTSALYGSLGVHGINEFYSGLHFVDFVGGTNLGTNVMPPQMYASYQGTVDYVCKDSANVGIRVNYQDDVILFYLHLIDNPALTLGRTFAKGDLLGTLKPGTFTGESTGQGVCGGASQQGGNYHVHWGFYPANGRFQVENCILAISTQIWTCGDKEIAPGKFITRSGSGGGSGGGGGEGPTQSVPVVNFWDYFILGLYSITEAVASILPQKDPSQMMVAIVRMAGVVLRIGYTLANTVLNLTVLWMVLLAILALEALRGFPIVLRFIKKYIPFA